MLTSACMNACREMMYSAALNERMHVYGKSVLGMLRARQNGSVSNTVLTKVMRHAG